MINRIQPVGTVRDYQTYAIASPRDTQVKAACEEVGCANFRHGWRTIVDEATDLGKRQADYIRNQSRRTFREERNAAGLTVFTFESGQRCFADHRTRPEVYLVRDGDWRGNPTGHVRRHTRPADWVEDFGEHQQRVVELINKG
ncbi:hypothetical protein ABZ215_13520 [Amycolatopsis sp. NPDC006131]|uniref:hypothetical protein n=1 Tax=Amycolatopsis sp. NPDC006131 TaxID=3156731 RepID=UPI0033A3320E